MVLVSVDGLRSEFFLDPRWPAPTLQQLVPDGGHVVRLRSVAPSLTYPAHATLVTGALPARHGIVYNRPFERAAPSRRWYWEADHLRCRTLWEAVRDAEGRTASLTWPTTLGAGIDWNLPEVWDAEDQVPQPELLRRHAHPPGLLEELERKATGRLFHDLFRGHHLSRADAVGAMAAHLIAEVQPQLLMVHLVVTDVRQHAEGRDGPGVQRAVAAADRAVDRIIEAVERSGILDATAFVIVGDHGFVDIHTRLAPNVWLARAGLAGRTRFHVEDGSAFLHVLDGEPREVAARARRTLAALPERTQRLFRIVNREELDRLGAAPEAVFALSGARGVAFREEAEGEAVLEGSGGAHGHFPDLPDTEAGLVVWGAGVRPDTGVSEAELADVAPLVAALLGLDFDAPDGLLLPSLLTGEAG